MACHIFHEARASLDLSATWCNAIQHCHTMLPSSVTLNVCTFKVLELARLPIYTGNSKHWCCVCDLRYYMSRTGWSIPSILVYSTRGIRSYHCLLFCPTLLQHTLLFLFCLFCLFLCLCSSFRARSGGWLFFLVSCGWYVFLDDGGNHFRLARGVTSDDSKSPWYGDLFLGGGFKYFLCSPLFGEDSHID